MCLACCSPGSRAAPAILKSFSLVGDPQKGVRYMSVQCENLPSYRRKEALAASSPAPPIRLAHLLVYLLALVALYLLVSKCVHWGHIMLNDLRYGRPRTAHLAGFVGHNDSYDTPTRFIALNLHRQIVVLELPGGDASQVRSFPGPYLFGAEEELTPVTLNLRDMDDDGLSDLLIIVHNEQVVYLNREGTFRLPSPEEQAQMAQEHGP